MRLLFLSFLILTSFLGFSQNIKYQKTDRINFKEANDLGKLVFVNIRHSGDQPRNFLDESGLYHPNAGTFYNENFINYLLDSKDSLAQILINRYNSKIFPAYYFIDSSDQLIYKDNKLSKNPEKYLAMADSAIRRFKIQFSIKHYKEKFKEGLINKEELKDYINLRMQIDSFNNAELIEKYADFMTDAESDDLVTVMFVLKAGPLVGGTAYKKAFKNNRVKNEAFKLAPESSLRMRENTLTHASKYKDINLAKILASYHQFNTNKSAFQTERYSPYILMSYYRNVKDTLNYLEQIVKYYNPFTDISLDSSKKYDEIIKKRYLDYTNEKSKNPLKDTLLVEREERSNRRNYPKDVYALRLTTGATLIYDLKIDDPKYLYKGIRWAKKAQELAPEIYQPKNILAKLLYRSGFFDEAEKLQMAAIAATRTVKNLSKIKLLEEELLLIRNRTLK